MDQLVGVLFVVGFDSMDGGIFEILFLIIKTEMVIEARNNTVSNTGNSRFFLTLVSGCCVVFTSTIGLLEVADGSIKISYHITVIFHSSS